MKLILQIALGVFLGTLASQFAFDNWRSHRESQAREAAEKLLADQERIRMEQGARIRALLMQGHQGNTSSQNMPPSGFSPDNAQEPIKQK